MREFYLVNKVEIVNPLLKITIEPTKPMELPNLNLVTFKINSFDLILHCEISVDENLYSKCSIVYSKEEFLEDLKFLENSNFTIEIEHDNLENLTLQPKLHTLAASPLTTIVKYIDRFAYTRVNWDSYVGKDSINVFWGFDHSLSLPVEIRASKIDYYSDFRTMVNNINSICSTVLWSNKSNTSLNVQNTLYSEKNLLGKFFFIRSAFNEDRLPTSFQEIVNAPITKLEEWKKELTIGEVSSFDYKTVTSMINSPYWVTTDPATTYLPNYQNSISLPYILNEHNTQLSYDTTENRFIKYLLEEIYSILSQLVVKYTKQTFVGLESFRLLSIVDRMLSNDFLHEVNNIPYVETGNLALRRVPGYSDFFSFYEQLIMSETLHWEELYNLLFHKQIKPIYDIYEAWVLTEFMEILKNMSTGDFRVEFGNGKKFIKRIRSQYYSFNLEILYQQRINHSKKDKPLSSYSMRMDPDFLLNIYKEDKLIGSVVFDAKYKLNKTNDIFNFLDESLDDFTPGSTSEERISKRVDLMTMHAYKDSIRGVMGSYVILPSIERSIEFWNENKDIVPSIGAVPLYPSNNNDLKNLQRASLTQFIKKLVTHFKRKGT